MAPIGLATIVAISRVVDYRHDFADVNAGAFIGILSGTFAYFLNYPSPFSKKSDSPRLRPVEREGAIYVGRDSCASDNSQHSEDDE